MPATIYAVTLGRRSLFVTLVSANPEKSISAIGIIMSETGEDLCNISYMEVITISSFLLQFFCLLFYHFSVVGIIDHIVKSVKACVKYEFLREISLFDNFLGTIEYSYIIANMSIRTAQYMCSVFFTCC